MSEPLMRLLADLPIAGPDTARAERTRARCRAQLERQRLYVPGTARARMPLWQPLIAALGVVYLIAAIVQALSVLTFQF